ncbi:hypothetical protein KXS11_17600 [Plantibacter flavus]|uniref:hypothetical protein n=1 Tax=Plantibacter flavus TaxID=150123 RepID=UPI003F16356A
MLYVVLTICAIRVVFSAACIALGWFVKNGTLKSAGITGAICGVAAAAVAASTTALVNFGANLQLL